VLRWLAEELRTRRVDVAHSFLWSADAAAALSRRLFGGPPLLISERGDRSLAGYSRSRNGFDRVISFRAAYRAVANSQFGARLLVARGCPEGKVQVIPNGVDIAAIDRVAPLDLRARFGWPESATIVGCVARLVDYKGIDNLIRALAALVRGDGRYRCVLAGDGPQRAELEQLAGALGLSEHVRVLGLQRPVIPLVKALDIAALTTTGSEHSSNSILEYLACGIPTVVTDVGGNGELVAAGDTGLLVPPGDSGALAAAIASLVADPERARQMAIRGRKKVETDHAMRVTSARFTAAWLAGMERRRGDASPR
jgi:glycosyltransferase involved in cell wall biosynthesis